MKKRILSAMLLAAITTTGAIANETKPFDLKSNYKNTKEMMSDIKEKSPEVNQVVTDYFQAKTCKEDITSTVSEKEIRKFLITTQYGVLIAMKYQYDNTPIYKANYDALLNAYKSMNCDDTEAFRKYGEDVHAIAVEMNSNQAK